MNAQETLGAALGLYPLAGGASPPPAEEARPALLCESTTQSWPSVVGALRRLEKKLAGSTDVVLGPLDAAWELASHESWPVSWEPSVPRLKYGPPSAVSIDLRRPAVIFHYGRRFNIICRSPSRYDLELVMPDTRDDSRASAENL